MTADFGQPAPKAKRRGPWRRHVLTYALVGPAVGWAVALLMIMVAASSTGQAGNLGGVAGGGGFVVLSLIVAYLLGGIPAACTGLVSLSFRRFGRAAYVIATTAAGGAVTALPSVFFIVIGQTTSVQDTVEGAVIAAVAIGGPAALVCALLTMKRPPNPGGDLAAVFE